MIFGIDFIFDFLFKFGYVFLRNNMVGVVGDVSVIVDIMFYIMLVYDGME